MIKMNTKFKKHLVEDVFKDLLNAEGLYTYSAAGAPFGLGLMMKEIVDNNIELIKNNSGTLKLTEAVYMNDDKMYYIKPEEKVYFTISYNEYTKRLKYIQNFYNFEASLEAIIINFIDDKLLEALVEKFGDDITSTILENKNILLKNIADYIPTVFSLNLLSCKFKEMSLFEIATVVLNETLERYVNYRELLTTDDEVLINRITDIVFYYMKLYIKYFTVIQIAKLNVVSNMLDLTKAFENNFDFYKDTLSNIVNNNRIMNELFVLFKNNEVITNEVYDKTSASTLDIFKIISYKLKSYTDNGISNIQNIVSRYLSLANMGFNLKIEKNTVAESLPLFIFYTPTAIVNRIQDPYNRDTYNFVHLKEDTVDYNTKSNEFINDNTADLFCVFDRDIWSGIEKQRELCSGVRHNFNYNDGLLKSFKSIGFSFPFTYSLAYDAITVSSCENFKLVLLDPENEDDENMFNDFIFNQKSDFNDMELFDSMYQDSYDEFYYKKSKYGIIFRNGTPTVLVNITNPFKVIMGGIIYKNSKILKENNISNKEDIIKFLLSNGVYPFTQSTDITKLSYLDNSKQFQLDRMCVIFILELIKYLESKQNDGSISIRMVEYEKVKAKKRSDVTFEITERKSSWVRAHYRHYKSGIVTLVTAHHRKGCHLNKNTNEKLIINL